MRWEFSNALIESWFIFDQWSVTCELTSNATLSLDQTCPILIKWLSDTPYRMEICLNGIGTKHITKTHRANKLFSSLYCMAYGFKLPLLYSIQYELSSVAPELWNWTTVYFKLWFTLWYSCGIILEVATSDASCHFSAVSLKKGNGTLWISCGCFYLSVLSLDVTLYISFSGCS